MKTYLIAHTPCSGALWLCDTLARNGLGIPNVNQASLFIGYGTSIKDRWPDNLNAAFAANTNEAGLCGFKTDITYLEHLNKIIKPLDYKAEIFSRFTHFIHLKRDVAVQAVAWSIARANGQWIESDAGNGVEAVYDPAAIAELIQQINLENERWNWIFESLGVEPLLLNYDDLIGKGGMGRAIKSICNFLGVDAPKKLSIGNNIELTDSSLIVEYTNHYTGGAEG